jgi:hypothetical protein
MTKTTAGIGARLPRDATKPLPIDVELVGKRAKA